jgi:hypothetical protein
MIIMELGSATPNPSHDGRKRSGWQSAKEFPKGQRFALNGSQGGLGARFIGASDTIEDPRCIAALLAAARPSEPKNYAEISASFAEPIPAETVLDRLIAAGTVQPSDVQRAVTPTGDQA